MKLKRTTKMGTYTVVIALIVLAAIIFVNLIISALPSKYTVFDTSAEKLYSISEESEKSIKNIKEDVVINFICSGGAEDENLRTFLNRYASANPKIKIKVIDPVESPAFILNYTEDELSNYSLIIESAKRFKIIDYNDIYVMDLYAYYYQGIQSYTFNGERLVTSALDYVTTNNMPKIYTLNGHNEAALSETLKNQISDLNYTLEELILIKVNEVPADASAIIINVPTSDINEDDAKKLKKYIDNGGKVFLITSAAYKKMQNLNSVTEHMGLTSDYGIIIEKDSGMTLPNQSYALVPKIQNHAVTSQLMNSTFPIIPYAHPIRKTEKTPEGVTVTELFTTSDKSYTVDPKSSSGSLEKTEESLSGPFSVASVSEQENGGALVWISSDYSFNDNMNSYSSGANYKYFLSVIKTISPRDTIITEIPGVTVEEPMLKVTEDQAKFWNIVLTFVVPFTFIGIGVLKWAIRRRK